MRQPEPAAQGLTLGGGEFERYCGQHQVIQRGKGQREGIGESVGRREIVGEAEAWDDARVQARQLHPLLVDRLTAHAVAPAQKKERGAIILGTAQGGRSVLGSGG